MEVFKIITKNWDDVLSSCAPSISLYLAGFANFQTFKFAKICLVGRYFCKSKNILQRDWIILSDISIYLSLKLEVKLYSTLLYLALKLLLAIGCIYTFYMHVSNQNVIPSSFKFEDWKLQIFIYNIILAVLSALISHKYWIWIF